MRRTPEEIDSRQHNCIMVCALRKPELVHTKGTMCFTVDQYNTTARKIKEMLDILLLKKQYYLVLGALGCGAYGNPAHEVAEIFRHYLLGEYKNKFHTIVFAIIDGKRTNNLQVFKDVFSSKKKEETKEDKDTSTMYDISEFIIEKPKGKYKKDKRKGKRNKQKFLNKRSNFFN